MYNESLGSEHKLSELRSKFVGENKKKRKFTPKKMRKIKRSLLFRKIELILHLNGQLVLLTSKNRFVPSIVNAEIKTPRSQRQPEYPQNSHATILQQLCKIIPYVPPPHGAQFASRNVSQHYQPYAHGPILNDGQG